MRNDEHENGAGTRQANAFADIEGQTGAELGTDGPRARG